jgi:hypothetical protein
VSICGKLAGVVLLAGVWPSTAWACPICLQGDPGGATDGLRAAVLVLGGVASAVLVCCGTAFVRFLKRDGA